ncbi:hypothetical protein D3C71_1504750 [compost metagenome]
MESTTLNCRDAFSNQLLTAVNQTCVLCAIFHGTARNRIIIFLIRLAQVRSICIRNRSLLAHPQQCSAGIQAARKSDANTLSYRKMLENRRHKIKPCLID